MWLASPQASSVFLFPPLTVALTFFFFFKTWTIFKVFTELITTLLLVYALVLLARRRMGSQLPDQELNPNPLHWKAKFNPGLPGKSPDVALTLGS